ncbi:RNA methyltransferase [Burkholderia pseudomallei]|uniref:RNA methyltransferase n=1 Tax=Burkholderia pseudomallei TaxID=28450 RepID=UPI000F05C936|nr:RNA methyltransferase [Burkholderia pseudomallei]CAJ2719939.1 SpoU rRNA Methylase family [Burkholderia pseudomallei]VBX79560.1 SpoU rRNA Methylase family [Burkholderia pseudomallei]VBX79589.1 SpoU rRNA Methylase family [Burkholderia pseudomallei]VBX88967.1 SpoU rRNA Methylase family [Burkholderia pseudomallei]VBX90754.1 SpoU rRNA Methylase family [Burkholderia pseudomallei]
MHQFRGFAAIGLDRPKSPENIGGVLRAAGCYGAELVAVRGNRIGRYATDTMKAYRKVPSIHVDDLISAVPFGCVPVAVELVDDAESIVDFVHPACAFYIFGPEDGSVAKEILRSCPHVVYVPTAHCMNLAATVNVVLYDRLQKQMRAARVQHAA